MNGGTILRRAPNDVALNPNPALVLSQRDKRHHNRRQGLIEAFDIVRVAGSVDLDDLENIDENLHCVTIFEIKSTRKNLKADFSGYFFALTAAELLVAQSLKSQFKFALVNTGTGEHLEMDLNEIFVRAKGVYPTWSICF